MSSQLPHFIQEQLVQSSVLHTSRKYRSTLALLMNLHLYEVHNKQVLNFIDLQNTILTKVQNKLESIVPEVNGLQSQASDILGSSAACSSYTVDSIILGKYIYQNRNDKKVYILLKCWDSMVIVRKECEGFALQAEYEGVRSFKIRKDANYQVLLAISFLHDEDDVVTNFQENQHPPVALPTAEAYRKTLDQIKMKQSELLVHKAITKKEFAKLKSINLFGCNFLRTPRLEEMQILSKCSDAWVKVTANDDIVIGVPLINNCSTRLTILRNLRGVFQCHGSRDLNYKFALYQLDKRLCDMENIQSFFQVQDDNNHNTCSWSQCPDLQLRPDAFCVLILRIKLNEFSLYDDVQLPLFVFYDVIESGRTFLQKCFVTKLSFHEIFNTESCRLNFHEKHLHRDLLTVIATSYETEVIVEFNVNSVAFEDYLSGKMGFFKVSCNQNSSNTMHVDGEDEDFTPEKIFFYNKNSDSVWHGTLLAITYSSDSCLDVKIYTKTQEKSKVFLKLLHTELRIKCCIKEISADTRSLSTKLIAFETALRDECCSYLEMCSSTVMKKNSMDISKKQDLQKALHLNELKTDVLFRDLKS